MLVVTLNAPEVAVQVLPVGGFGQVIDTAEPERLQFALVLWLALGPQRLNWTEPVGVGEDGIVSGEMLTVAVSVTEAPLVTVPVELDCVVVKVGCWTKKHSLVTVVLLDPV